MPKVLVPIKMPKVLMPIKVAEGVGADKDDERVEAKNNPEEEKPEDRDDEEDGEPGSPMKDNPAYKGLKRMDDELSASGLQIMGCGIPIDLYGPFMKACARAVRPLTDDDAAKDAPRDLRVVMTLGTYHHDQHCPNIANSLNVSELRECARCYADGQAYAAEQHRLRMIAAM